MKIISSSQSTQMIFEKILLAFKEEYPNLNVLNKKRFFIVKNFCDPVIFLMKRLERKALINMFPGETCSVGKNLKARPLGFSTFIMLIDAHQNEDRTCFQATPVIGNLAIFYRDLNLISIEMEEILSLIERIIKRLDKWKNDNWFKIEQSYGPPESSYM